MADMTQDEVAAYRDDILTSQGLTNDGTGNYYGQDYYDARPAALAANNANTTATNNSNMFAGVQGSGNGSASVAPSVAQTPAAPKQTIGTGYAYYTPQQITNVKSAWGDFTAGKRDAASILRDMTTYGVSMSDLAQTVGVPQDQIVQKLIGVSGVQNKASAYSPQQITNIKGGWSDFLSGKQNAQSVMGAMTTYGVSMDDLANVLGVPASQIAAQLGAPSGFGGYTPTSGPGLISSAMSTAASASPSSNVNASSWNPAANVNAATWNPAANVNAATWDPAADVNAQSYTAAADVNAALAEKAAQANATKWNVSQDQTVAGQIQNLLDPNSPLIQQARTGALQQMAARGLTNSSMALTAGDSAAYGAVTPIATADASTFAKAASYNADTLNQQAVSNAAQTNQVNMQNAANQNQVALANQSQKNTVGLTNAQQANQVALANAAQANNVGLTNAQQANQVALANAAQANNVGLTNAQQKNQVEQFNTQQQNTVGLTNAQQANQIALANQSQANEIAKTNAQLANATNLANSQQQNQVNIANLNSQTTMQQANLTAETQRQIANLNAETSKWTANLDATTKTNLQQMANQNSFILNTNQTAASMLNQAVAALNSIQLSSILDKTGASNQVWTNLSTMMSVLGKTSGLDLSSILLDANPYPVGSGSSGGSSGTGSSGGGGTGGTTTNSQPVTQDIGGA